LISCICDTYSGLLCKFIGIFWGFAKLYIFENSRVQGTRKPMFTFVYILDDDTTAAILDFQKLMHFNTLLLILHHVNHHKSEFYLLQHKI